MTAIIRKMWPVLAAGSMAVATLVGLGWNANDKLASKADASKVDEIEREQIKFKAHHEDDDRRLDWLVEAIWKGRADKAPPDRKEQKEPQ